MSTLFFFACQNGEERDVSDLVYTTSDECPSGTGLQTPNRILQSCPTFVGLRRQTWPSPMESPQEAVMTCQNIAVDCGLCFTHRTENLAWLPGDSEKKEGLRTKPAQCSAGETVPLGLKELISLFFPPSPPPPPPPLVFIVLYFFFSCLFLVRCLDGLVARRPL